MAKNTQDGRQLAITTPLGKDILLIRRMSATEGLSKLFSIETELLLEETQVNYKPHAIQPDDILGQAVTILLTQQDGGTRTFSGIVNRFSQGHRSSRFSSYNATIVPRVWVLTQTRQSRIFQQMTVPDILRKVFEKFTISVETQGDFKPRNYCVQYRESDFDFASRLMEEEGIYYFFEHADGTDKMVIGNDPGSHPDCEGKAEIPFYVEEQGSDTWVSSIRDWRYEFRLQTGKITRWDHNFQLPGQNLSEFKASQFTAGGMQELEYYDYPGGYARKFDGIDKSGGEADSDLQNVFNHKTDSIKYQIEALDANFSSSEGFSDCGVLTAGHKFKMINHPSSEMNKAYVLTTVNHYVEQGPDYDGSEEESLGRCEVTFSCIPHGEGAPVFRPLPTTSKPKVYGTQTAMVVGTSGEEITTDKYGRIKVQFHWDRDGGMDIGSSCWCQVAQTWAGNGWGTMFIPRIGMEVVVQFLEGDPDQPIVMGCVYNPSSMPPYTLPDEKTKSTIKTNTTTGGGGYNEIRFEDKAGDEQIFINGEKDLEVRMKNNRKEYIGNDRHLMVVNNQYEEIQGDKHLTVKGDKNEKVTGNTSLTNTGDIQFKTDGKFAVDAGQEIHLKAGMKVIIEAMQVSLKAGSNFVDVGPMGVSISGTMVNINSGGAAGSGSGSSPTTPDSAQEAVSGEAGRSNEAPQKPPATEPSTYSAPAAAMSDASASGSPFCGSGS